MEKNWKRDTFSKVIKLATGSGSRKIVTDKYDEIK